MKRKQFLKDGIRVISISVMLMLVISIIGCASVKTGETYSIMKNDFKPLSQEKGRIFFYRPSAFFGAGMQPDILLNEKKVGISSSGTFFYTDVNPGKYKVATLKTLYSGEISINFEVNNNETVYVRTSIGGSSFAGITNVELIPPEQAITEINDLKWIEPLK